ncbi:uncharacterized protein LOC133334877 [Musca vetustissima]|uniref:uncharacterized protein LOC133334877 n=1 Tax=Musca vetustissima TaxID=27455 RepID=UPI002AB6E924|nr:uncharacterized protein LOC133334877 [Musca vetustissima]
MRAFIVLTCLMAMACADHLGPDYHPVGRSYIPPGGVGATSNAERSYIPPGEAGVGAASNVERSYIPPGGAASNIESSYSVGGQGSNFQSGAGFGSSNAAVSFGNTAAFDAGNTDTSFVAGNSSPTSVNSVTDSSDYTAPQGNYESASNTSPLVSAGGIEKEFYTFTADEEDFAQPAASNQFENSIKQGVRVIFIKGPENNGLENAIVSLAKQASEQKTDIYVLTKHADLAELNNKLNTANDNANHKPEVHFVKYRTAEDAANAQHAIQAEYEALGGPAQYFDGGVAPSLNFASQAPLGETVTAVAQGSQESMIVTMGNVGSTYLPASVLRLFRL